MANGDFQFNEEVVEVVRVTGNRRAQTFFPAEGSTVAVIYLNASSNLAQIQQALDDIAAVCDEYRQLDWNVTAKPNHQAAVRVAVTARNDVPAR